jgi:prepilin-type N-terminal cleavage/methylation domain-containing protein
MQKGMSLMECLVVLLLLGVLMNAVIPSSQWLGRSQALKQAARKTVAMLRLARLQAITRHQNIRLIFDKSENLLLIISIPGESRILKEVKLKKNITIIWRSFPAANYVAFNSLGQPRQNGTLYFQDALTNKRYPKKVVVSTLGSIRVLTRDPGGA